MPHLRNSAVRNYLSSFATLLLCSLLFRASEASSIEPCLSAQSVNLASIADPNIRVPIDCQCSNTDLICINLQIYNSSSDADGLTLPTLSVLFQQDVSSLFYILPKQRFSFFGYKYLVPETFKDVKFVNEEGVSNFNDQTLFIDFIEANFFPSNTFKNFGNLNKVNNDFRFIIYDFRLKLYRMGVVNFFVYDTRPFFSELFPKGPQP